MQRQQRALSNSIPFSDPAQHKWALRMIKENIKLKAENKENQSRLRNVEKHLDGHSYKKRVGFNKQELKEFFMTDIEFPDGEGFDQ
jgi:hypothetical protein